MDAEQDRQSPVAEEYERRMREAQQITGVAEAIAVYKAASARAPYVEPPAPDVEFSTGANDLRK